MPRARGPGGQRIDRSARTSPRARSRAVDHPRRVHRRVASGAIEQGRPVRLGHAPRRRLRSRIARCTRASASPRRPGRLRGPRAPSAQDLLHVHRPRRSVRGHAARRSACLSGCSRAPGGDRSCAGGSGSRPTDAAPLAWRWRKPRTAALDEARDARGRPGLLRGRARPRPRRRPPHCAQLRRVRRARREWGLVRTRRRRRDLAAQHLHARPARRRDGRRLCSPRPRLELARRPARVRRREQRQRARRARRLGRSHRDRRVAHAL